MKRTIKDKREDFIPNDVKIEIVYEELYLNLKHQGYVGASRIAYCSKFLTKILIKWGIL